MMNRALQRTARTMMVALVAIVLALAAIGLPVAAFVWPFEKPSAYALGLLAGGGLSFVKLLLLRRGVEKNVDQGENAANFTRLSFFVRYLLTAAVLAGVVLLREHIGIIGTLMGIVALQLSAYVAAFAERRREDRRVARRGYAPPREDD